MMLADLGADVIKVENPAHGDQTRKSWGYSVIGDDSRAFLSLNRNKRSIRIDLKTETGLKQFFELVKTADVVIENFRPGVAARLGIGYDAVRAANPQIVYASISGFGQSGPYASYPGYDLIAQAMTGVMSVMGEPGGRPIKSAIPIADLGAGMFCTIGVLSAIRARDRDGEGQYLETSLFESALAMSVWESTEFWSTGESPEPLGSANRMSAPYQALQTADGYVTVGANNEKLWRLLCKALDAPELIRDKRYADNNARLNHRDELAADLEVHLKHRDTDEWVEILLASGVPAGAIRDYKYVLTHDEHVRAREMVAHLQHPVEGDVAVLGTPIKLHGTPVEIRTAAPLLGQDDDVILTGEHDDLTEPQ